MAIVGDFGAVVVGGADDEVATSEVSGGLEVGVDGGDDGDTAPSDVHDEIPNAASNPTINT